MKIYHNIFSCMAKNMCCNNRQTNEILYIQMYNFFTKLPSQYSLRERLYKIKTGQNAVDIIKSFGCVSCDIIWYKLCTTYIIELPTESELIQLSILQQYYYNQHNDIEYATLTLWLCACQAITDFMENKINYQ